MNKSASVYFFYLLLAAFAVFGTGCSSSGQIKDAPVIAENHQAAEILLRKIVGPQGEENDNLRRTQPIIVASFSNIDNLEKSSTFGRMVAEQIGSYFIDQGFQIIEMRLRSNVFIKEQTGELMLSRELRDITSQHNAQAIVVGTYATAKDSVFVTAKVVRALDGIVLASHDYRLPLGPDTRSLLRDSRSRY